MVSKCNAIDAHVGAKLKAARLRNGVSQSSLGALLGVTFQQIQKYERGRNRLSASMLFIAAHALHVGVSYFFEGLPLPGDRAEGGSPEPSSDLC